MQLTTYLNYGGNCEEAFRFYEQHLGGRIQFLQRHGELPGGEGRPIPNWGDKVLHAQLALGGTTLLGADVPSPPFEPMRSAYLTLTFDNTPETERVYEVLSEGGQLYMPMNETFFAYRFAMLRDRFGTSWMLLHPKPMEG
jgi:PhnB protein